MVETRSSRAFMAALIASFGMFVGLAILSQTLAFAHLGEMWAAIAFGAWIEEIISEGEVEEGDED